MKMKYFGRIAACCGLLFVALCSMLIWLQDERTDPSDGLAPTPPMGWNSWNKFHCHGLTEALVHEVVVAMVTSGLRDAGYVYVNLDDCWQVTRNNVTHEIEADKAKFPSGMQSLGQYIHEHEFLFGLYTDIGTLTCAGRPGSYQYETLDAKTYASWGVDLLKNDDCHVRGSPAKLYKRMWDAMRAAGRPMIHSIKRSVPKAAAPQCSNMQRVGPDIHPNWYSILEQVDVFVENKLWQSSGPGFWNDLDMLEVGNGDMARNENIAHMALWCALKSPLLLGNDIRTMDDFTLQLLMHPTLLAINQDPLGEAVHLEAWYSPPGGGAQHRVVSRTCQKPAPSRQAWRYIQDSGLLENEANGRCLSLQTLEKDVLVTRPCQPSDPLQQWLIFESNKTIQMKDYPSRLLRLGRNQWSQAWAQDRRQKPDPDWSLVKDRGIAESDQYSIVPRTIGYLDNSKVVFDNCLTVGDQPEIQVFSGALSGERCVIVVLNRDEKKHTVPIKRSYITNLPSDVPVILEDAYQQTTLGSLSGDKQQLDISVDTHYATVIIVKQSD